MMYPYLQVALGGAIGATCRFAIFRAMPAHLAGYGLATAAINILGSFLMGLLVVALAQRLGQAYAPFLLAGLLGGFTTFSAFSLDVIAMWERGQAMAALLYIAGSVLLSIAAVAAGLAIGRGLWA